jgi:hypothetical protein
MYIDVIVNVQIKFIGVLFPNCEGNAVADAIRRDAGHAFPANTYYSMQYYSTVKEHAQ